MSIIHSLTCDLNIRRYRMSFRKEIHHGFTRGFAWKQLNYPRRSLILLIQPVGSKKSLTEKLTINKMYKTTNLQINNVYTFYLQK